MSNERRIMDDQIVAWLRKARALIEHRRNWARGHIYIERRRGPSARCAGMVVVDAVEGTVFDEPFRTVTQRLANAIPVANPFPARNLDGLIYYNDTHTHAEVLALFDRAITMRLEELGCQSAVHTT